jgi:hypothetical protein
MTEEEEALEEWDRLWCGEGVWLKKEEEDFPGSWVARGACEDKEGVEDKGLEEEEGRLDEEEEEEVDVSKMYGGRFSEEDDEGLLVYVRRRSRFIWSSAKSVCL